VYPVPRPPHPDRAAAAAGTAIHRDAGQALQHVHHVRIAVLVDLLAVHDDLGGRRLAPLRVGGPLDLDLLSRLGFLFWRLRRGSLRLCGAKATAARAGWDRAGRWACRRAARWDLPCWALARRGRRHATTAAGIRGTEAFSCYWLRREVSRTPLGVAPAVTKSSRRRAIIAADPLPGGERETRTLRS
jgi:hypothetical protein